MISIIIIYLIGVNMAFLSLHSLRMYDKIYTKPGKVIIIYSIGSWIVFIIGIILHIAIIFEITKPKH